MLNRQQVARGLIAGFLVLTLAACGASSDNGSSANAGESAGPKPTGPKPTGTPLVIGVIGSLTGPQASSSSQGDTVAPAWAEWFNAAGGINGHPIKIVSVDDGGDPAKAQAAAAKLIDQENVLAIVVGSDNLAPAYGSAVRAKGVPLISGSANTGDWYKETGMFPTVTDVVSGKYTQLLVAKNFGKAKKYGELYCAEIAACASTVGMQKANAEKLGMEYTALPISSTATSYTAQCLQLQQKGVDYVQLNLSTAPAIKLIQDCQAQSYNPTWGSSANALSKQMAELKNVTIWGPAYAFPSVADLAPAKVFRDAMLNYAKDDNWHEGTAGLTWSGLEVLRKALADVGPNPTRKDVMDALYQVKNEDLDGLLANKITFTAGQPTAPLSHPCAFVLKVADGKTTSPSEKVCANS
ncbi:ABC transporter substrate-binding protein [Cryptosporangium sp. NPDC051539]|uniref:ABC transporter substrate-binding protein n=1 Tax=Cryptosporangium sp. NPDC051539 TaxID=3363962 RepID=UPI0037AC79A4